MEHVPEIFPLRAYYVYKSIAKSTVVGIVHRVSQISKYGEREQ